MKRQSQYAVAGEDAQPSEDPWYVFKNDEKFGPLSFGALAELAGENGLEEDDWLWKPGLASWIAARDVSGLFAAPAGNGTAAPDRSATAEEPGTGHGVKERAKHQITDFALMFVYLWAVFGMLAAHESLVLAQHHIDFKTHGVAFVNALIFAKVMLVGEDLHLGRRLDNWPLIYPIAFKSILFAIALICFHIVEHVAIGIWDGRTIAGSMAEVGVNRLTAIVSIGIMATVALVPFFILRELNRVIGAGNFWALFFRRRRP